MVEVIDYGKLLSGPHSLSFIKLMTLTLKRIDTGIFWGFEFKEQEGSLVISSIVCDSPADACHCLHLNDELISVNGILVSSLNDAELMKILEQPDLELVLAVFPCSVANGVGDSNADSFAQTANARLQLLDISLCQERKSLGFTLAGYSSVSPDASLQRSGVFIATAEDWLQTLGMQVGDQLIEISGAQPNQWISVRLQSLEFAQETLDAALHRKESLWIVVLPRRFVIQPTPLTLRQGESKQSEYTSGQRKQNILEGNGARHSNIQESASHNSQASLHFPFGHEPHRDAGMFHAESKGTAQRDSTNSIENTDIGLVLSACVPVTTACQSHNARRASTPLDKGNCTAAGGPDACPDAAVTTDDTETNDAVITQQHHISTAATASILEPDIDKKKELDQVDEAKEANRENSELPRGQDRILVSVT